MAKPTNPTLDSICQEALKKTGLGTPSGTTQLTRATTNWIEEIKNDIMNRAYRSGPAKFATLSVCNQYEVTTIGLNRYSFPTNFLDEDAIELLDGDHTDTAQAGANLSITLAADEDALEIDVVGKKILITSGTGSVDARRCTAYDTTTKVATITPAWSTNPDATTKYVIINKAYKLIQWSFDDYANRVDRYTVGRPTRYHKHCDRVNNYFYFDVPPDKSTYGIHVYYYINLHEIDLTEDTTLISKIYQNWQGVLGQGIYYKALEDANDDRSTHAKSDYERLVAELLIREMIDADYWEGFEIG